MPHIGYWPVSELSTPKWRKVEARLPGSPNQWHHDSAVYKAAMDLGDVLDFCGFCEACFEIFAVRGSVAIEGYVWSRCKQEGVGLEELRSGSRRRPVSRVRLGLGLELTNKYGVRLAEVAQQTGVSSSAISRGLRKMC